MTVKSKSSEVLHDVHNFNINIETRELYLHSHVGDEEESGVDYRMAVNFIKNLNFLSSINTKKDILVHMITGGGDYLYGMAIYDVIKSCPNKVIILSYGQASSMSSIILQAGQLRILMPNVEFMIHFGTSALDDNHTAVVSTFQQIDLYKQYMLDIYVNKCVGSRFFKGKTTKSVRTILNKKLLEKQDWFLSPKEAVEYNLADGILGTRNYESIQTIRAT